MKKELRLRKKSDFYKVFKDGRRFVGPRFVLYALKTLSGEARLGVSISKIHYKLATKRNRLRRIIKEMFRNEFSSKLKEYDLVVTSRAKPSSYQEGKIQGEVKELFLKAEPKKC